MMKVIYRSSWRLLVALFGATSLSHAASHPLAPLSVDEIKMAVGVLKANGQLPQRSLIASLTLLEPDKRAITGAGNPLPLREAVAVIIDHAAAQSREVRLELGAKQVRAVSPILNGQPLTTFTEYTGAAETVRNDPKWQAAVRLRGITDFQQVALTAWAGGHHPIPGVRAHRIARVLSYHQGRQTNSYGPPIEGIEALVDLERQQVLQVIDTGVRPVPRDSTDFFDPKVRGLNRARLKPLLVTQPEGPSFRLAEYQVEWDLWRFGWSFNAREGLVLHQIRFVEAGRERSILHRASISEMLVPYGSPEKTWYWRDAVDQGEYGLGHSASLLVHGQTVPPHATLLDVPVCSDTGEASIAPGRVAIYERLNDSLWSHTDGSGAAIGRPSRELVMTFLATVGNYDYRYTWSFRQDGVIEFEVGMTGILLMSATEAEKCLSCEELNPPAGVRGLSGDERYGTLVAPNTLAVNHQHFINLRLDFDIEGSANSVKEINARILQDKGQNPYGNAWQARETVFGKERESVRNLDWTTHRHWVVFNPNIRTQLGHFPSYMLEPGGNTLPLMQPENRSRRLLGFINDSFHATRYRPQEFFAGGKFPNQITQPNNLETWTADNESIRNEDVVLWYTLGMTHIPRPEEFPVMPTASTRFRLVPKGFFVRNPALDVPEERLP